MNLPEGFVLDKPNNQSINLPEGFVLDEQPQPTGQNSIDQGLQESRGRRRGIGATSGERNPDNLLLQLGQGANDVVASLAGLPVDVMESILNLGVEGINAAAGTDLPLLENSVGGYC